MTENNALKAQWLQFINAANALNAEAAWKKIPEEEIFAVKNSDGVTCYVSVLGPDMDVDGFLAYRGPHGLMTLAMLQMGELDQDEEGYILAQDALMVSFEKGSDLAEFCDEEEIELLKELTGPIEDNKIYPLARSFKPGYLPYKMDAAELDFTCLLCERLAEVGKRFAADKKCLHSNKKSPNGEQLLLTFVPDRNGNKGDWEERWFFPDAEIPAKKPIEVEEEVLKALKEKKKEGTWEMVITYTNLQQNGVRPYIPMQLVVCEKDKPVSLVDDIWEPDNLQVAAKEALLKAINSCEKLPATILCPNDALVELYGDFFKALKIKVKVTEELPTVDEVLDEQNECCDCDCGDCDDDCCEGDCCHCHE